MNGQKYQAEVTITITFDRLFDSIDEARAFASEMQYYTTWEHPTVLNMDAETDSLAFVVDVDDLDRQGGE